MAAPSSNFEAMRRSTRVRADIPVRLRSLDPQKPFDILTRTLIVNAQGCGLHSPSDLAVGTPVEIAVEDRVIRGRILNSTPVDPQGSSWVTGIELETPGNVWGLPNAPADWPKFIAAVRPQPAASHPFAKNATNRPGRDGTVPAASVVSAAARFSAEDALREVKARADALADEISARLRTQGSADLQALRHDTETALHEMQQTMARELAAQASQLRTEAQQAGDAFQRLSRTAEERHQVMLADLQAREAELKVREQAMATVAEGISAQISRQVEEAMSGLRTQIDQAVARQEAELTAKVAGHHTDTEDQFKSGRESVEALYAAANRALEQLDERERKASALNADMVRAAEAALESIDQQRTRAEASVLSAADTTIEQLKADLAERERQFEAKTQQASWDYDAQVQAAGERLDGRLASALSKVDTALAEGQAAMAAAVEAQRQAMESGIAETVRAEAERHLAVFSEEAKRQADDLRRDWEQTAAERGKSHDSQHDAIAQRMAELSRQQELVAGQISELQQLKQQIESFGVALKDSMAAEAHRHATEAWNTIKANSEELVARGLAAGAEQGAGRVGEEIAESARRLSEEMAARAEKTAADLQGRLADALAARQEQISRDIQAAIEQATTQFSANTQRQAEEQQRAAEQIYQSTLRRLEEVSGRSETLLGETEAALYKSAESVIAGEVARAQQEVRGAVGAHVEDAVAKVRAESEKVVGERTAAAEAAAARAGEAASRLEQAQSAVHAGAEALEKAQQSAQRTIDDAVLRSQQVLRKTEEALHKSASEITSEETARARREIQSAATADVHLAVDGLRSELAKIAAEYSSAAQTASDAVARLQQMQGGADSQAEALRRQLDEARQWLAQHTEEFKQSVHDAFLQAGGEIRGRVHAAVDTADEMILQKSRQAMASMESVGERHAAKLAAQADDLQLRIAAAQANVSAATESALQERLAETLQRFRDDAARLAQSAGLRWQSAIDETLRSLPDLLRARLDAPQDPNT